MLRSVRVASLCGSDRPASTNAVVTSAITGLLVAEGASVEAVDISIDLPSFRPDLVDDPPAAVGAVQRMFAGADGVVFVVPEYAGGPPGWVKNLTDWMVGSASLYQRPVIVVSAATGGGRHAIRQLARTLTWQGAFVVASCGIAAPSAKVQDGCLVDPATSSQLDRLTRRLVDAISGGVDRSVELALEALAPLDIDLHDRTT